MVKTSWGMKRTCPNPECSRCYYDFCKKPVICPRCGTEWKLTMRRSYSKISHPMEEEIEGETAMTGSEAQLDDDIPRKRKDADDVGGGDDTEGEDDTEEEEDTEEEGDGYLERDEEEEDEDNYSDKD